MALLLTRIALTAVLFSVALSASAIAYPDRYCDYLISTAARHSSESQIYPTSTDSLLTKSCMYIQPQHNGLSSASYIDKYSVAGSGASLKPLIDRPNQLTPSCMDEPTEHITVALSEPLAVTHSSRTRPYISSAENSWDYPQEGDTPDTGGATDKSSIDENGKVFDHNSGMGFAYWHVLYDNGPLTDGRFYSLYYDDLDKSQMESVVISIAFGTYTLADTGFVADAVKSANSIEINVSDKQYGDQMLFIASPYFLFSFAYGYMWFNYSYPITYSNGYTSSGEYSRYIGLRTGLGGELGRYGALQISAYAGVDARIYYGDNNSDYSGELFQDTLAFTLGASIGLSY